MLAGAMFRGMIKMSGLVGCRKERWPYASSILEQIHSIPFTVSRLQGLDLTRDGEGCDFQQYISDKALARSAAVLELLASTSCMKPMSLELAVLKFRHVGFEAT